MMHCPIGEVCRTWTDECDVVRCIQKNAPENETCLGHEILATRYRQQLLNLAHQRLHNWEDAEDCVQEAIMRAMRGIHTFRCECSVSTWLWRIVTRTASNMRRAKSSRGPEFLFSDLEDPDQRNACPVCDTPDPDAIPVTDSLIAQAEQAAISEALKALPVGLREILHDHYLKGENWKEMAARMEVDEKTLRIRRHRAERLLRAMLERAGWTPGVEPVLAG